MNPYPSHAPIAKAIQEVIRQADNLPLKAADSAVGCLAS
jgi:hypothetical protein